MASTTPGIRTYFNVGFTQTGTTPVLLNWPGGSSYLGDYVILVVMATNNGDTIASGPDTNTPGWRLLAKTPSGRMAAYAALQTGSILFPTVLFNQASGSSGHGLQLTYVVSGASLPLAGVDAQSNPAKVNIDRDPLVIGQSEHYLPMAFVRKGANGSGQVWSSWGGKPTLEIGYYGMSNDQGAQYRGVYLAPATAPSAAGTGGVTLAGGTNAIISDDNTISDIIQIALRGQPEITAPTQSITVAQHSGVSLLSPVHAPSVGVTLGQSVASVLNVDDVHAPAVALPAFHEHSVVSPAPNALNLKGGSAAREIAKSEWLYSGPRAFIAEARTGLIVDELPFAGTPSWSRQLNDTGSLAQLNVDPFALNDENRVRLRQPWRWIIGYSDGGYIGSMGYLTGVTLDDSQDTPSLTLATKTLGDLLAKRVVGYPGVDITSAAANVIFGDSSPDAGNQKLGLPGIMFRLFQLFTQASAGDPYADLPVVLGLPFDPVTPGNQRTYAAADLITVWQALTDLTGVIGGPEFELSPEFADSDYATVQWRVKIGNPRLGQLGFGHVWDYQRALQSLVVTSDGTDMAFRALVTGQDTRQAADTTAGTPASGSLLHSRYEDDTYPAAGWPMLVAPDTAHTEVTVQATLDGYAQGDVQQGMIPTYTATAVVRGDGTLNGQATGSPDMSLVSVGDTGYVGLQGHALLPDGQYGVRVLEIASGQDLYTRQLSLQLLDVPKP